MKKVLIIAHFWPYRNGSGRVIGLAKYLPEFGWHPLILTGPLQKKPEQQFSVIETPCPDVVEFWKKKAGLHPKEDIKEQLGVSSKRSSFEFLLRLFGAIVCYPDRNKWWKKYAIEAGNELLEKGDIDAMISIWPVTSHIIANKLKAMYKIPWIADLPDPWSQNHNYTYGRLRKMIDKRLELKTLLSADALITVTQPWAENLKTLHKRKSVSAITHGFDPSTLNIPPANLTAKFTITYTGQIYTGKQDPSKLFAALKDLISDGTVDPDDVEVRFYGSKDGWLTSVIKEYGLSTIAKQYGTVSREISFEKQKESQLLLLLNWEDQRERGVCPLKTFEYLAAQRPILATGSFGNDVVEMLLEETKAGVYAKEAEDIKSILRELYSEYKSKGEINYRGNIEKINKYSYREIAKKFAEVLELSI